MEKFVNDVVFRLSTKLSNDVIEIVRNVLYSTLEDYDITERTFDLAVREDDLPREAKIYLASRKVDGLSEKTLIQYHRTIKSFCSIIKKNIPEVQTEDCRLFFYQIQKVHNMSNVSLNNQRSNLNAFFMWLNTFEYIEKNPCRLIKPFKCEKKHKKALTEMELERLRDACRNTFETAILEVLYSTACRVSELVNIRLDDIDFYNEEIIITHGKGNKARTTYLNPKAIIAIQNYVKNRDYDTVFLFENSRKPHGQLGARTIEKKTKELEERTGIRLYSHKVRRTSATHLWKKGMPIEKIQVVLGHEDINTTMIYTDVDHSSVKADFKKFS